jgi:uncharacterized protein (TIGR00730 family)
MTEGPYKQSNKQLQTNDMTWRIFRIMAEFVEGFNFLSKLEKTVSIFGSARFAPDNPHYNQATELSERLAQAGFVVITGGGPGIMEAANKGASTVIGRSAGLNILLPSGQRINQYVQEASAFHYFFTRKVMMAYSAQAYVFFPGGFGTLDEFFEIVTLIQTKKITEHIPVVCIGRDYWQGLFDYIWQVVCERHKAIDVHDMDIWKLTDDMNEVYEMVVNSKPREIL